MDAINVISRALDSMIDQDVDVFRGTFRRGQVYNNKTRGIQCFTDVPYPWRHGPGIAKALRQVEVYYCHYNTIGYSGYICFVFVIHNILYPDVKNVIINIYMNYITM